MNLFLQEGESDRDGDEPSPVGIVRRVIIGAYEKSLKRTEELANPETEEGVRMKRILVG